MSVHAALTGLLTLCFFTCALNVKAAPSKTNEHQIECPLEMPEESLEIKRAPAGWTPSVRSRMLLHAVDLTFGPPSARAFLKPDVSTQRGKQGIDKWINLNAGPSPEGTWVACNYGDSDTVILGKRLDDKVSECTATYSKDAQRGRIIEVRCTW